MAGCDRKLVCFSTLLSGVFVLRVVLAISYPLLRMREANRVFVRVFRTHCLLRVFDQAGDGLKEET